MQRSTLSIACLLVSLLANSANGQALVSYRAIHHPEYSRTGMVAAQNRIPAEIGAAVLADGGNAVDAAVAVGFALAVTIPRAGNIGGGGFMLVYDAESGETTAIDYREMAPLGATRDMFLDADGNPDPSLSRDSHLASGVPSTEKTASAPAGPPKGDTGKACHIFPEENSNKFVCLGVFL